MATSDKTRELARKLLESLHEDIEDWNIRRVAGFLDDFEREVRQKYEESLDKPELEDFAKGVVIEAQHQRKRWGNEHDTTKEPEEWFWVVGYLAGKGLRAQRDGDLEKFKHHLITGAAVLANWHARILAAPPTPEVKK